MSGEGKSLSKEMRSEGEVNESAMKSTGASSKGQGTLDDISGLGVSFFKLVICIIALILFVFYIVLPIAPMVVAFIVARFIERLVYMYINGLEAVTGGDSVWLSNGPENLGIISALLIFDGEIDLEKFRKRIFDTMISKKPGCKVHPYRRCTKKVSSAILNHFWEEEESFDIKEHVKLWPHEATTRTSLREIVSNLCALPFRMGMSQWEFVVIPWLQNGGQKSVVMFRAHHSLADGGSLVHYLTTILPDHEAGPVSLKKFSQKSRIFLSIKGLLLSPFFLFKMLTGRSDATILHGRPLSGEKVVSWSDPLDLLSVKKIGLATKTTLNDVLVSCMTASIREFFLKKDLEPPQDVKVSIPIDLRKNWNSDAVEFENRFAVLQLALPTGISDPLLQLCEVQSRMDNLKTSGEPFAVGPTMDMLLTLLPTTIISPFFNFIVQKTTGVLSNVPGPQRCLRIAGNNLENLTFWAPPRGNLGITFSITSYNGKIIIGVQSDKAVLEDPEEICGEFPGQLQRLMSRLNITD